MAAENGLPPPAPPEEPLVVGRPNVLDVEGFLKDIREILSTRLLTNHGPFVVRLERAAAEYLGVAHVVAVANGTIGLELALRALDLAPGADVLLPSFTFIATAHAVRNAGLKPVFSDVDEATHFPTPATLARAATNETRAVVAAHLWGRAGDAASLEAFAAARGWPVVYDSAHAFGARHADGAFCGGRGRAEVFSLHATKLLNSFEGGLVATNDATLAARVMSTRNFGFAGQDTIAYGGTNAKLSEPHAALALRHLRCVDATISVYRRVARAYGDALRRRGLIPNLVTYWNEPRLDDERDTHAYVIVRVRPAFGLSRDAVMRALRDRGVHAKRYFFPGVHKQRPFLDCPALDLETTDALNSDVLILPTGTVVSAADVERVVAAFCDVRDHRRDYADAPPLAPREFDTSHYAAALRTIGTERDALRVRLAELDRAEAALEKDRAGVVDRVASLCL